VVQWNHRRIGDFLVPYSDGFATSRRCSADRSRCLLATDPVKCFITTTAIWRYYRQFYIKKIRFTNCISRRGT